MPIDLTEDNGIHGWRQKSADGLLKPCGLEPDTSGKHLTIHGGLIGIRRDIEESQNGPMAGEKVNKSNDEDMEPPGSHAGVVAGEGITEGTIREGYREIELRAEIGLMADPIVRLGKGLGSNLGDGQ